MTIVIVIAIAAPVSRTIGKAQVALYRASITDALTGLLNRGALLDGVNGSAMFVGLGIVDVDHFKDVNDKYGHWFGDQVLRLVADSMMQSLGEFGRVGRLGGEEFALLAFNEDGSILLREFERFRIRIAETPILNDKISVSVTISAGIAMQGRNQTFEQLFARADRALYAAKASGRNKVVFADELDPVVNASEQKSSRRQSRQSS
ncbi:GGDEF domain-containing protein [Lichenicola cladoniae]|uniref:diguanylate cyclase n=1 Tax=Lichenicola cladoniae TaxID=1484109 RepID=A0A6M8H9E8_9PROT|nr:GGDEF domain-containing protein [Lichenicola cladoniae]NPD69242.1 GGDEF domain-containing protein [Acetobacteraceae bacterium]QKE89063.1 GGDEF domain-containing protein [Lichenicola cladoniae]